ncbi:winged helix-turn-helix domain-containing protein, partial [Nitrobacter winogradskyi]
MSQISLSIRVDLPNGKRIGPGKIALLEAIRETGSISGGARRIGMSYRRAWLLVDEINHALTQPAVATSAGGNTRGGATLTAHGARIVDLYRSIEKSASASAQRDFKQMERMACKRTRQIDLTGLFWTKRCERMG